MNSAWPPGRKDLHRLIVPGENFARKRLYEPYRLLSEQPGLHPVQPQWMHLTVLHAGPQDSASAREVDQITREVPRRAADTDPFEVRLSRPDTGALAIESKGYPGWPHRQLWEMTWQAHQTVVGDRWPRIPTASYPHLSHAYAGLSRSWPNGMTVMRSCGTFSPKCPSVRGLRAWRPAAPRRP